MSAVLPPLSTGDTSAHEGEPVRRKPRRKKKTPARDESAMSEATERSADAVDATQDDTVDGAGASQPRLKKKKKKRTTPRGDDQLNFDGQLPPEFLQIEEDIIEAEKGSGRPGANVGESNRSEEKLIPSSAPSNRIFLETPSGFTSGAKLRVVNFLNDDAPVEEPVTYEGATVQAAVYTQKAWHGFSMICHGLLAGMSAMQVIFVVFLLAEFGKEDFVVHYEKLAMPFIIIFYILLVICVLSALDKWDLEKPTQGYFRSFVTFNAGTIASISYFVALIISCVLTSYEDRISLLDPFKDLWYTNYTTTFEKRGNKDMYKPVHTEIGTVHNFKGDSNVDVFQILTCVRCGFICLGWLFIALVPHTDDLAENLEEMEMGYEENQ